ncbi:ankyrin repeat domain-containing protein 13C-like isoform X3 [Ornithodoros turicata]|uniref:ankyrin repeat domain-containing protein 13C-like isoform X3 n=1 Tax=Ornithodoros turicata TaxID=34597 RepID=UPI003139A737
MSQVLQLNTFCEPALSSANYAAEEEEEQEEEVPSTAATEGNEAFPLHKAVFENDYDLFSALLPNHNIAEKDVHGNTPLHLAVMLGRNDFIEALLTHNAPVNARNLHGWSCLHEAVSFGGRQTGLSLKIAYYAFTYSVDAPRVDSIHLTYFMVFLSLIFVDALMTNIAVLWYADEFAELVERCSKLETQLTFCPDAEKKNGNLRGCEFRL